MKAVAVLRGPVELLGADVTAKPASHRVAEARARDDWWEVF